VKDGAVSPCTLDAAGARVTARFPIGPRSQSSTRRSIGHDVPPIHEYDFGQRLGGVKL
jgi:hypothetical protein